MSQGVRQLEWVWILLGVVFFICLKFLNWKVKQQRWGIYLDISCPKDRKRFWEWVPRSHCAAQITATLLEAWTFLYSACGQTPNPLALHGLHKEKDQGDSTSHLHGNAWLAWKCKRKTKQNQANKTTKPQTNKLSKFHQSTQGINDTPETSPGGNQFS